VIGSCQVETRIPLDPWQQVLQAPECLKDWTALDLFGKRALCASWRTRPPPENRAVVDDNKVDGVLIKQTIQKELRDRTARISRAFGGTAQGPSSAPQIRRSHFSGTGWTLAVKADLITPLSLQLLPHIRLPYCWMFTVTCEV
jgi:hypothetical protein